MQVVLSEQGFKELRQAVISHPEHTKQEIANFLARGLAAMRKTIMNNPWKMGMSGGGSPVAAVNGGNLRDTHKQDISPWQASIGPSASYASYVHGIEGWPRKGKYQLRPWLDYAVKVNETRMQELEKDLLNNVVAGLI